MSRVRTWPAIISLLASCSGVPPTESPHAVVAAASSGPSAPAPTPASSAGTPPCTIIERQTFQPQGRTVALLGRSADTTGRFAMFSAPLRVNTDGAPNSYHPDDLTGERLAINNILNGIAV